MARKRAREEPAEDQQVEHGAVEVAEVQAAALERRQATARDVARRQGHWLCCPVSLRGQGATNPSTPHCRRAAHFAHFNTEDDSAGAVNIHAGGSEVVLCCAQLGQMCS